MLHKLSGPSQYAAQPFDSTPNPDVNHEQASLEQDLLDSIASSSADIGVEALLLKLT